MGTTTNLHDARLVRELKNLAGASHTHAIVLEQGKPYAVTPLADDEARYVKRHVRYHTPKGCFMNAGRVLLRDGAARLTYAEGFALTTVTAIMHAWLLLDGQKVIEPTLDKPALAYRGIAFDRVHVCRHVHRTGNWESLIETRDLEAK